MRMYTFLARDIWISPKSQYEAGIVTGPFTSSEDATSKAVGSSCLYPTANAGRLKGSQDRAEI